MNATLTTLGILLNDRPRALAAGTTLMELLREAGLAASKGVAAAVNGEVVPRRAWTDTPLADGSVVEVVTAVQGG